MTKGVIPVELMEWDFFFLLYLIWNYDVFLFTDTYLLVRYMRIGSLYKKDEIFIL